MIPEVKKIISKSNRLGISKKYNGQAIIEFEDASKLRRFINENHKIVRYNGEYYKIHRNKSNKLTQLKCNVESMSLRELNLEELGI
jgi:hypothetical protein